MTTDGLVVRAYASADSDKLLYILTPEKGCVRVLAKGVRSPKSKNAAASQLFAYGNYELYEKNGMYWLRGATVSNAFFGITDNLSRMALAAYLCDLASEVTSGEEDTEITAEILRMLLNSLYVLSRPDPVSEGLVKGVFELRAMALSGYRPRLTGCYRCGQGYPDDSYFDIMDGSMICADCQTKRNQVGVHRLNMQAELLGERHIVVPMNASVLTAVRYALAAPEKRIFSFSPGNADNLRLFTRIAEEYVLNHLEHGFETLTFYHTVEEVTQ